MFGASPHSTRRHAEADQADDEHPPPAVEVGQRAGQDEQRAERQQVAVLDVVLALEDVDEEARLAADCRQRDGQHRCSRGRRCSSRARRRRASSSCASSSAAQGAAPSIVQCRAVAHDGVTPDARRGAPRRGAGGCHRRRPARRPAADGALRAARADRAQGEHDVVTEVDDDVRAADHRGDPRGLSARRVPGRGVGPDSRRVRPAAKIGQSHRRPEQRRLDRRPARRHGELRQRHPGVLRQHRAGDRRRAGPRRRLRPGARRDVHAQAGLGAQLDGAPIRHPAKEKLSDLVRVAVAAARRLGADATARSRKRIRVSRIHGQRRAGARLRGQRPLRRVRPGRRPVAVGHLRRRADRVRRAARRSRRSTASRGSISSAPSKSIGLVAAAPTHHRTLMELLRQ